MALSEAQPCSAGGLLDKFRVVELATYVAGPAAACILGEWGAEIIKVEQPGGDPLRWLRADAPGGLSPAFETINRGKLCIELDTTCEHGREAMRRLIGDADVFITNIRPAGLTRAGLDWPSLKAINPQLIYASITGYGLTGADANTPAFDNAAFWARSGMADVTRPEGSDPFSIRQGLGDHTSALALALGIVTALLARERGGGGRLVEASLLRTGTYVMGSDFANHVRFGDIVKTHERARAANPLNNFFQSSDGRWFFCMPRNAAMDWHRICEAAGVARVLDDPRFVTPQDRADHSAALIAMLDKGFAQMSFDVIAARLVAADIVWSPVQNLGELLADPQAAAAGCFIEIEDTAGERFPATAAPVRFDGDDLPRTRHVPALGQDTQMILSRLGLNTAES